VGRDKLQVLKMMDKTQKNRAVQRRNDTFVEKQATKIWQEQPSANNPYTAESVRCYGYDLLELMNHRSYIEVLYLLFQGDLPSEEQTKLLEKLLIAFINPGPRHPSTRAAMNAGIGKTDPAHILPISLSILGGSHLGAGEIEGSMRFLRKHSKKQPDQVVAEIMNQQTQPDEGDWHIAPGFGNRFGGIDAISQKIADQLVASPGSGPILAWGSAFADAIKNYGMGWLTTGIVAATLADLRFQPRTGGGFFQLLNAPGLLAHGLELTNKPFTAMPFPTDEDYIIE